jgi:dipeptidyl aminopeptidase/acylaminoacyl peptidase
MAATSQSKRATQGASHIWIFDAGRDVAVRLRDDPAAEGRSVWSPDGRRIALLTAFQGQQMLIERALGGRPGSEKILVSSGQSLTPLDWSADGRFLPFSKSEEKTGWDIWALPLTDDRKPFPVAQAGTRVGSRRPVRESGPGRLPQRDRERFSRRPARISISRKGWTQGAAKLVPRHRWVDQDAPGIDAASHALARHYALFPQPVHHVQAAHSVVAEDN